MSVYTVMYVQFLVFLFDKHDWQSLNKSEFVSSLQMGSVGLIGGNEDRFMKTLGVLLHHWLPPRYPKNRDISAGKDN